MSIGHGLIRAGFLALNHAPSLAAYGAEELLFTPRRSSLSPRVRQFLATGRRCDLSVEGVKVAVWEWGRGRAVLLVHGWAGVGGQLAAFAPPLVAAGYRVVAFDAPGHGASGGRRSSMVHFARALRAVASTAGAPHGVIAHSLGAAATALALARGLRLGRAVFIGPTSGPRDWTARFARHFGIAPDVMGIMRARTERKLGLRWDDLDVPQMARHREEPLLVIHDRDDLEVPSSDGAAVADAWPGARLLMTAGLGHRRILRDPAVVAHAVAFVTGDDHAPAASADCEQPGCENAPAAGEPFCRPCALERELYFRDTRPGPTLVVRQKPICG